MRCKTGRFAFIGLLLLGLMASDARAQGNAPMPQGSGMMGPSQLTSEQQARVQKIYQDDGQKILPLRQQLMSKQYELNALMTSQNPDEKRTQALIKEISNLDEQVLLAEAAMQRRLSQAGCPMCGTMGGGMGMMGGRGGMGMGRGMMGGQWDNWQGSRQMGPGMMGQSQLTPEQQAKAQQIYQDEGQKIFRLRQQLMSKQYELNALVTSQNPDEKRVRILTKDISSLNEQILQTEATMQRRLSQAGVPSWGYGMCPMCGDMGCGMGMMGGPGGMGMGHGGNEWEHCGW